MATNMDDLYYYPDVLLDLNFGDRSDPDDDVCHCGVPRKHHNAWREGHTFVAMPIPEFNPYDEP